MIKDKISHLHTIWADLCKTMNKPGGMTAAEAIGASTGPVNDQAVRLRTWYEQSGLVPWHSRQAMTTTVFDATLRGLCGVVVNGLTLCMTTDGFKVTGDVLGEASDTLRALTTLAPRSPDMPVSEDLYAVAKVIEHKFEELTKERDGLRRDLISARSKIEALTIQGQIADGAYQSLRRFVTYAAQNARRAAKYKALCKSLLARLHKDAPQKDWTLAVTPNPDSNLISGLTPDQERAALMIWPTCGGAFKIGETQVMAYRGTAEQVAGVAEYLGKHGFGVAWERQT